MSEEYSYHCIRCGTALKYKRDKCNCKPKLAGITPDLVIIDEMVQEFSSGPNISCGAEVILPITPPPKKVNAITYWWSKYQRLRTIKANYTKALKNHNGQGNLELQYFLLLMEEIK